MNSDDRQDQIQKAVTAVYRLMRHPGPHQTMCRKILAEHNSPMISVQFMPKPAQFVSHLALQPINSDLEENWYEISEATFRSGRGIYSLRYKISNDHDGCHVSDIQVFSPIKGESPPFGYQAVFCTEKDAFESTPLWICFTTTGPIFVTSIALDDDHECFMPLMKTPAQHSAALQKGGSTFLHVERKLFIADWEMLESVWSSNPLLPFLLPLIVGINSTLVDSSIFALEHIESLFLNNEALLFCGQFVNWIVKALSCFGFAHPCDSFYRSYVGLMTNMIMKMLVHCEEALQHEVIFSGLLAIFQVQSCQDLNRAQWLHDIAAISLSKLVHKNIDSCEEPDEAPSIRLNDTVIDSYRNIYAGQQTLYSITENSLDPSAPDLLPLDWMSKDLILKSSSGLTGTFLFLNKLCSSDSTYSREILIGLNALSKLLSNPILKDVLSLKWSDNEANVICLIRRLLLPPLCKLLAECHDALLDPVLRIIEILLRDYFFNLFVPNSIMISSCLCPVINCQRLPLGLRFRILQTLSAIYCNSTKILVLFREIDDLRPDLCINPFRNLLMSLSTLASEVLDQSDDILRRKLLHVFFNLTKSISMTCSNGMVDRSSNPQELGLFAESFRISDCKGVSDAIKFLRENGIPESGPVSLLTFLINHPSPISSGKALGGSTAAKLAPDEERLRSNYLGLFSYYRNDVISSMRSLFGGIGLHLPSEAQQIERILQTFSSAILYKNSPQLFAEQDDATTLTYLLLMHNTSAHNPKLKIQDRIPLSVFLSSLSSCCKVSQQELIAMHNTLLSEPFAHEGPRFEVESIWQKTLAKLHLQADVMIPAMDSIYLPQKFGLDIVSRCSALFIEFLLEPLHKLMSYDDMRSIVFCVGSFKHMVAVAVSTDRIDLVRKIETRLLSACFPIESEYDRISQKTCSFWKQMLTNTAPEMSLAISIRIDSWIKRMVFNCNMNKLNKLEESMQGEYSINLVDSSRKLLAQGSLWKRRRRSSKEIRRYDVFLFSDVFIYGTSYYGPQDEVLINVHRVLQIAYCDVVDFDDPLNPFAFRLVNPQKEVVFIVETADDKERWQCEIEEAIVAARAERCTMVSFLLKSMERDRSEALFSLIHLLSTTSAFIGKRLEYRGKVAIGILNTSDNALGFCKLCLRSFSRFHGRRKRTCISCNDTVCSRCLSTESPGGALQRGHIRRCVCCSAQLRQQTTFLYRPSCKLPWFKDLVDRLYQIHSL